MFPKNYQTYIQSNKWQLKRKQKAIEKQYKCEKCGKIVLKGYHIHHKTYKNFENEPLSDLMFLCEKCHKKIHEVKNNKKQIKKPKTTKVRKCENCLFSQYIIYKGKNKIKVLYCNLHLQECKNVCKKHNFSY